MNEHTRTWEEIRQLLRGARNCLALEHGAQHSGTGPVRLLAGTLDEFQEFLDHNELELAWDALAEVAERSNATPACWSQLAHAARLMQLPAKEEAAARRAR